LDWQYEPDANFEPDSLIRRRFAYWLVLTRNPNAAKVLESHLTDQDFTVRDDALVHLGELKSPEALETLQKHAGRPEPQVRAMAVKGLAHWGVFYLLPFLDDTSHEVRLSVAEELGRFPTREAAIRLRELQADASGQVESAALESTRSWPDVLAIPVLLHGMEHASIQTRRECFRELRRRTEIKDTFPIATGPDARKAAIGQLVRDWNLPAELDLAQVSLPPNAKVNRLRVEELRIYLEDVINPEFPENSARHQAALKALKESAVEEVPAIETFVLEQPATRRTDVISREVLPALDPAHAAIQNLQSPDVRQRRTAVNELRSLAERQSLSPLALRRLGTFLKTETDGLVWRSALHAILADDNAETSQIFAWAANHQDAGIRQLACEFAARHKRHAFADWLLPLLHDSQSAVKLAAIEAAGQCGNRIVIEGVPAANPAESLPGLKPLLADPDSRVSLAAAIAISRLGDPLGHDELLRLSQHADERIRLRVIAEMGSSRQTRFVEALIGIGWTARSDRVKREVLNSLEQLIPTENQPSAMTQAAGVDDRIKLWVEWWDENRRLP
jgi:HEAT repeat protein